MQSTTYSHSPLTHVYPPHPPPFFFSLSLSLYFIEYPGLSLNHKKCALSNITKLALLHILNFYFIHISFFLCFFFFFFWLSIWIQILHLYSVSFSFNRIYPSHTIITIMDRIISTKEKKNYKSPPIHIFHNSKFKNNTISWRITCLKQLSPQFFWIIFVNKNSHTQRSHISLPWFCLIFNPIWFHTQI